MNSLEYSSVEQSDEGEKGYSSKRRRFAAYFRRRHVCIIGITVLAFVLLAGRRLYRGNNKGQDDVASERHHDPTPQPSQVSHDAATTPPPSSKGVPTNCKAHYECKTDRLGHNRPLQAGQAICNRNYMIGVSHDGHQFHWRDCNTNETHVYYKNSTVTLYFEMRVDASWNVLDKITNDILWKEECLREVHFYPECLSRPLLDCPYLHLRKGGNIVLNWIDGDTWMDRSVSRVYKDLYP